MTDKYAPLKSTIIDLLPVARAIEQYLEPLHLVPAPPPGAYLKNMDQPSLIPGGIYYEEALVNDDKGNPTNIQREVRFNSLDHVIGHIFGQDDEIVVYSSQVKGMSIIPTVPAGVMEMMRELMDDFITGRLEWTKQKVSHEYDIINRRVLHPPHAQYIDQQAIADRILFFMRSIETSLSMFMGGDNWNIYRIERYMPCTAVVHKCMDYRIATFNEKVASGEWKP